MQSFQISSHHQVAACQRPNLQSIDQLKYGCQKLLVQGRWFPNQTSFLQIQHAYLYEVFVFQVVHEAYWIDEVLLRELLWDLTQSPWSRFNHRISLLSKGLRAIHPIPYNSFSTLKVISWSPTFNSFSNTDFSSDKVAISVLPCRNLHWWRKRCAFQKYTIPFVRVYGQRSMSRPILHSPPLAIHKWFETYCLYCFWTKSKACWSLSSPQIFSFSSFTDSWKCSR